VITFAGVVTLEDDRVPVTIGFDEDEVTLVSGRVEIGKWPAGNCTFVEAGDGSWVIEADDGSVSFRPDDPQEFEQGLADKLTAEPDASEPASLADPRVEESGVVVLDGPRPRLWTVVGFYALALATAALGVWAFINVVG
jgi:hypothetical protein